MANTEDQLIAAIESTLEAAHLQCQPYFLELVAEHPAGEPTSAAIAAAVSRGAVRRQFFC